MKPSEKLAELGIALPTPPAPVASYIPGIRVGDLVYVSGQIAFVEGKIAYSGKVGKDLPLEQGQAAARACGLNALAVAANTVGGIDRIGRIVRLAVFVNSAPGFSDQPKVANGASDLMVQVFGDAGRHVRAAVGAAELPLNSAVEVELIAQVVPGAGA